MRLKVRGQVDAVEGRRSARGARHRPSQDRFDRYGPLLAYVYVGGRNVNQAQIRRGWAEVYVYDSNPFEQTRSFRRASAAARSEGRGVWGACSGDFHSAS